MQSSLFLFSYILVELLLINSTQIKEHTLLLFFFLTSKGAEPTTSSNLAF
ncbi:hypothetical protein Sjap_015785 [Stephania japonica]|uniref:Uncharacterized protein n=1 Tax=Stephania japonica TaxID=461633 RepID=A0AAP0IKW0_9MAGN